ncbi:MAG: NifU family protein [Bdellovibrionota bacterium]
MSASEYSVELEFTPNPNTLKYTTNVAFLLAGAQNYKDIEAARGKSPLAEKLMSLDGVGAIMVGKNFVTVTLNDQERLTELNDEIIETIKTFLATGEKAVRLDALMSETTTVQPKNEIERKIVEILDNDIRPAVAMDGGDITFEKFEDGIVFLHLKGACAGCPSSTATLKMGIENRLKDSIPEVTEVVSI